MTLVLTSEGIYITSNKAIIDYQYKNFIRKMSVIVKLKQIEYKIKKVYNYIR